jgi:hypothetical protein
MKQQFRESFECDQSYMQNQHRVVGDGRVRPTNETAIQRIVRM